MTRHSTLLLAGGIILLGAAGALSQAVEFEGRASGWTTVRPDAEPEAQAGLRYIPQVSVAKRLSERHVVDGEVSANAWGTVAVDADGKTDGEVDLYRLWLRFSSPRFELRGGLQKINFGSAVLLRPLMWFDRIDPRDPLQLTDGVYGLLGRYTFLNNANVRLWGLYGNGDLKGWEAIPSDKHRIEYGGRLQFPLPDGELAVSYHRRRLDPAGLSSAGILSSEDGLPEDRFGLDGKWDLVVGLWFEAALVCRNLDPEELRYRRYLNVGLDYTFDLGNGLHVLGEQLMIDSAQDALGSGVGIPLSALSLNYPLGLIDSVMAIVYYDWENVNWYHYLSWQRRYDNWSLHLNGFWNPDRPQLRRDFGEDSRLAGEGLRLLVVFNH
jgi:hypothetical protein